MSNKLQALQRALDSKQPKVTKPKTSTTPARSESYRAPSREGKDEYHRLSGARI